MKRLLAAIGAQIALILLVLTPPAGSQTASNSQSKTQKASKAAPAAPSLRATINQYCVACHSKNLKSGGLALDSVDPSHVEAQPEIWEKVVRKLRAGMMPPLGMPRPDAKGYEALTAALENGLDKAAAANPNYVPPGLHRVNRVEYANAVRDLLTIDVDPASFLPVDDSSAGFDNVAGSLGMSATLLEAYMNAAGKISRLAMGHETALSEKRYVAPPDYTQDNHIDGLPFGSRGGMLLKHYFPADGEYSIIWSPVRSSVGTLFGGNRKGEKMEISIDGSRIKLWDLDSELQQTTDNENLETRVPVKAGMRSVALDFLATTVIPIDDMNQHFQRSLTETGAVGGYTFAPHVSMVIIRGPFEGKQPENTPSRNKILTCRPSSEAEELPCAKKILAALARQAFRRPVNDNDLEILTGFYQKGRNQHTFEDGIEAGLQRILADPQFIFRTEPLPPGIKPGQSYRISDLELASRLSFFLWSAPPDAQLLDLAGQGKLKDPKILEQQTLRLLADPRSEQLISNFSGQWLQLRNLASSAPTVQVFPNFDDNLRQAFRKEAELFFASIVREDRNVVDLLDADYTFVNERLAKHYGIPGVYGSQFRRVTLGEALDSRRGLLGKAAIELVTSQVDRTSPVQRGKWVLMNILGTIPPDPPPNVPPLKESDKKKNGVTVALEVSMRDRMEQHRVNPVCASCHKMMDPIGFALENFSGVGEWRTEEFGKKLDVSGQLSDGTKISGPSDLRKGLLKYSPQFVRVLTENLMVYAMGRRVEYYDMPVVRAIAKGASVNNNRFSSLVLGIVKSPPFQMNRAEAEVVASK